MTETAVEAYPLCWPSHRPRTKGRQGSRFKTSFGKARDNIVSEISRLGGRDPIISTNIPIRRDGLPFATFRQPDDPGVAVYFKYKSRQMCFACDRYLGVGDNLHAIGLAIGALRGIARWGTGDMMEAAFSGFAALPAGRSWRDVLELPLDASLEDAKDQYRRLSMVRHPDRGGSQDAMSELNRAWEQAQEGLS